MPTQLHAPAVARMIVGSVPAASVKPNFPVVAILPREKKGVAHARLLLLNNKQSTPQCWTLANLRQRPD